MDSRFLEFWGNWMLQAAKGQKSLEEMSGWISKSCNGVEEFNRMMRRFCGMEEQPADKSPEAVWEDSLALFSRAWEEYLILFDVAPKRAFDAAQAENEALKQRVREQEATIRKLRSRLLDQGADVGETVKGIQDLVQKQSSQFKELMSSFGAQFTPPSPKPEAKPKAAAATKKPKAKPKARKKKDADA